MWERHVKLVQIKTSEQYLWRGNASKWFITKWVSHHWIIQKKQLQPDKPCNLGFIFTPIPYCLHIHLLSNQRLLPMQHHPDTDLPIHSFCKVFGFCLTYFSPPLFYHFPALFVWPLLRIPTVLPSSLWPPSSSTKHPAPLPPVLLLLFPVASCSRFSAEWSKGPPKRRKCSCLPLTPSLQAPCLKEGNAHIHAY